jgi:SAM-dependent methyltransferase
MHPLLARIPYIRRPFSQRDVARRERDDAVAERDLLIKERDALRLELADARPPAATKPFHPAVCAPARLDASAGRICVFCNNSVEAWLPFRRPSDKSTFLTRLESVGSNPERFWCPHCSSIDRERHLRLFLERLGVMGAVRGGALLHMAPEYRLRGYIESHDLKSYVRGDLTPQNEGVHAIDLQQIAFSDETFDMVICNHMLEHVDDASAALHEIHRILKRGGRAICQTPFAARLTKTFEDPLLQSPGDRLFFYGQEDHVRLFGSDIERCFTDAGFSGRLVPHAEILPEVDPEQFGVNEKEPFFDFVRA